MNFNSAPSLIKLNTSSLVPEQVICFPSLGSRTFPPAHGFLLRLIRSPPHFYSSVNLTTQSGPLLVAPGEGAEGACSVFSLIRAVRGPSSPGYWCSLHGSWPRCLCLGPNLPAPDVALPEFCSLLPRETLAATSTQLSESQPFLSHPSSATYE